tara:strand:+ start:668 stop:919 length:252 start_codon:yes stop_codon:yes gene_type:complete
MEHLFNQYKNKLIVHNKYKGYVCGYNDSHIILAVETKDDRNFWRKLENPFIMEEYKDVKYRYIFEDEKELIKQHSYDKNIIKD